MATRSRSRLPALFVLGALALLVSRGLAIEVCFAPNELYGWNVTLDCDPLNQNFHLNAYWGFSEFGAPCTSDYFCIDYAYEWTVSSSDTDYFAVTGPLSRPTAELYLWLSCTAAFGGWEAAEFGVVATGADIVAFEPLNGVLNLGTATDLQLVAPGGCPDEPFLAGKWTLDTGTTSTPETWGGTWGRVKVLYR